MEDHVYAIQGRLHNYAHAVDERATAAESALAVNYLDAFGYLSKSLHGWKDINIGDIVNAIEKFQDFFGLPQTGQLCTQTVRAMETYRCGFPDHVHPHNVEYMKIKAFADTQLPKWRKDGISYCVQDYVRDMGKQTQDQIIDQAFGSWEEVCGVQLHRARPGEACDILVSTGQGQRSNFDGPGGVLAWAYMPDGSDRQLLMRFDLDETWVTDPTRRGILLLNVAAHEFGHLLGLDHSKVQGALMAPYYSASVAKPVANDDIPRAVARYGQPNGAAPPPPPPPSGGNRTLVISGAFSAVLDGKKVA